MEAALQKANTYLVVAVGAQRVALAKSDVRHVLDGDALVQVPLVPKFICGVANHAGQVVAVVDLAMVLGTGDASLTRAVWILVSLDGDLVGLSVDSAMTIEAQDASSAADAPALKPARPGVAAHFVARHVSDGRNVFCVLSMPALAEELKARTDASLG